MTQAEMRDALINNTIHIIASYGLDKATTKNIADGTNVNEAYIYRFFENKEDLFRRAFSVLDDELSRAIEEYLALMLDDSFSIEQRCRTFFEQIWCFLLENKEKCLAFMQYYYSPYFRDFSHVEHTERYSNIVEAVQPFFNKKDDVWMIINLVLNTVLDFVTKVHNGYVTDNENTQDKIFRLLYTTLLPYFNTDKEK